MTLDKVHIGLGAEEFQPSLLYVALSRVKNFNDLTIDQLNFTLPRFQKLKSHTRFYLDLAAYESDLLEI